jgi:HD-GYP domain-containing protein (c-di-GMP phosphodiesterase class II)
MVDKVKIAVSELQIGMSVLDLDRPWLETPFLFQGFILNSQADIQAVQQYCKFVFVDPSSVKKSFKKAHGIDEPEKKGGFFSLFKRKKPQEATKTFEKEIKQAKKTHKKSSDNVKSMMDELRLGGGLNTQKIKDTVSDCVDSVLRNPDAMMWLTHLKSKNDLEATHAINVCILAITLGRFMGFTRTDLENLGQCALLHDIGKVQLNDGLLEQATPLSANEEKQLRSHAEKGRMILMSATDIYYGVVDAAYTHHERIDGKGYPRGLAGNQISPFSKVIAVCDTFDSLSSEKPYRNAVTSFQALKYLNKHKNTHYDAQIVKQFIDMIGIFPIGSVVELNTGEVGVVLTVNRKKPINPKVLILLGPSKRKIRQKVVNLNQFIPSPKLSELKISKILKSGDYGIDIDKLKQRGLKLGI